MRKLFDRMGRFARSGAKTSAARPNAFATDIRRTITGNPKRFISLFIITALGATMLVGLKAACDDLRATADAYYDSQRLFDISIKSTLGLDEGDIEALSELDDVEVAEGGYTETAYTEVDGGNEKVDLKALSPKGLNEPLVVEGRLPRDAGEIAVTRQYLDKSGKKIGDTVTFESANGEDGAADDGVEAAGDGAAGAAGDGTADEASAGEAAAGEEASASDDASAGSSSASTSADSSTPIFKRGEYAIVGSVLDPMDVNNGESLSFRSTSGSKYAFFFTPAAVEDRDTFTVGYLTVKGAAELPAYSDEYDELIDRVKQEAEGIRSQREDARTGSVKDEANKAIDAEQEKADSQLFDAEAQLDDAQTQIDDALAQIASGKLELETQGADAEAQLAAAQREIDTNRAKLDAGLVTIKAKQGELDRGRAQAQDALDSIAQAEAGARQLAAQMGDAWPADAWKRLLVGDASARGAFTAAVGDFAATSKAQLDTYMGYCDTALDLLDRLIAGEGGVASGLLARVDELAASLSERYPDYAEQIEEARQKIAEEISSATGDTGKLAEARSDLQRVRDSLESQRSQLDELPATAEQLAQAALGKAKARAALDQIEAGQAQLDAARDQVQYGLGQLAAAQQELDRQRASAQSQLASGSAQLEEGEAQAASGQEELDRNRAAFEEKKLDAEARFARARKDVDGIERTTWYIQDRTSLPSYASVESDASSIESIATVFPLIFFTVAVLISLTTVTRMVEEDRGLIGVYKALGYGRARILSKYVIYAFAACLAGGIAGDILGFIALPEVIFTIFRTMYALPEYRLCFNAFTAFWGVALFAIGIVGATFAACRLVLRETPAGLMRPKAPRAGKRILLERIAPLWRRMGFLNKVNARNLFRYKKRFLMTVFGIAGCTALMICGLGIRDTVVSLKPRQYGSEGVVRYDLMAVTSDADFDAGEEELRATGKVDRLLQARVDTVTAEYAGTKESVQLVVVPDDADLSAYLRTEDGSHTSPLVPAGSGGADLPLPSAGDGGSVGNGVLITKNAEQVLGFGLGDTLSLQDSALCMGSVTVEGITINYLGNFVFMTQSAYEEAFGEDLVPNAFLVNLEGTDAEKIELADELAAGDTFVSVSSSTKIANDFQKNFKIIDVVVYVVTVMAAALAFAVVFTLSNTNISERERELATIKVLGFRKREVHVYINKETIVLTLIGIVAGFPLGYAITRFLTYVLRMPSLFFDTIVEWPTYVFAAVMSLVFTLVINQMTNRSLDKIDMVGALKSAE